MSTVNRRDFVTSGALFGLAAVDHLLTDGPARAIDSAATGRRAASANSDPVAPMDTKPSPLRIDTTRTVGMGCDMQHGPDADGGMFDHAVIGISTIRVAVAPANGVVSTARQAGMPVICLKVGAHPNLLDAGAPDSPNRLKRMCFGGIGHDIQAPDGPASRTLIRLVGSVSGPSGSCRQHGTDPTSTRRLTRLGVRTDLEDSTHG